VDCLKEPWDEVHLDHDLCGESNVDHSRPDCGMAVVRWILQEPRPQLKSTRFVVHSRNVNAASVMLFHLEVGGYQIQDRPFRIKSSQWSRRGGPVKQIVARLRWLLLTSSR
jgi:hypothetical protein